MTAGMVCYFMEMIPVTGKNDKHFHPCLTKSFVFPIFGVGGKGVKKAIKKVASGLVRNAEKSWFAELSDKGKMLVQ